MQQQEHKAKGMSAAADSSAGTELWALLCAGGVLWEAWGGGDPQPAAVRGAQPLLLLPAVSTPELGMRVAPRFLDLVLSQHIERLERKFAWDNDERNKAKIVEVKRHRDIWWALMISHKNFREDSAG